MIYGICHPYAIANTLLDISKPMNLEELESAMFMAQAIWLANPINEYRALFSETFIAARSGPALHSLHSEFRDPDSVIYNRANYSVIEQNKRMTFANPSLGSSRRDQFIRQFLEGIKDQDWSSWIHSPLSPYSLAIARHKTEVDDVELGEWGKSIANWQYPVAFG